MLDRLSALVKSIPKDNRRGRHPLEHRRGPQRRVPSTFRPQRQVRSTPIVLLCHPRLLCCITTRALGDTFAPDGQLYRQTDLVRSKGKSWKDMLVTN